LSKTHTSADDRDWSRGGVETGRNGLAWSYGRWLYMAKVVQLTRSHPQKTASQYRIVRPRIYLR
jgi:hypothetical protein